MADSFFAEVPNRIPYASEGASGPLAFKAYDPERVVLGRKMVDWLRPLQKGSPFFQYAGHDPLHHGLDAAGLAVAVATAVVLVASAVWGFRRRDVHG